MDSEGIHNKITWQTKADKQEEKARLFEKNSAHVNSVYVMHQEIIDIVIKHTIMAGKPGNDSNLSCVHQACII